MSSPLPAQADPQSPTGPHAFAAEESWIDDPELMEFLEPGLVADADPRFRERLRDQLWDLIQELAKTRVNGDSRTSALPADRGKLIANEIDRTLE